MMADSTFISRGTAADRLKITPAMLSYFAPCIFHFYIQDPRNLLWPARYINGLASFLRNEGMAITNEAARIFSRQAGARELMAEIMADFSAQRRAKAAYSTREVAHLFGLTPGTIQGWRKAGLLLPTIESTANALSFSREEILKVGKWEIPNA